MSSHFAAIPRMAEIFCIYQILLVMCSRGEPLLTTLKVVISLTTLLIFYQYIFWKHCFSIASLFTFKSCYKIMVLTHACLCIGWNTRAISCISGPIRGLKVNVIEAGQHTLKTQSDNIAITRLTWMAEAVKIVSLKKCCLLKVFSACWWIKVSNCLISSSSHLQTKGSHTTKSSVKFEACGWNRIEISLTEVIRLWNRKPWI